MKAIQFFHLASLAWPGPTEASALTLLFAQQSRWSLSGQELDSIGPQILCVALHDPCPRRYCVVFSNSFFPQAICGCAAATMRVLFVWCSCHIAADKMLHIREFQRKRATPLPPWGPRSAHGPSPGERRRPDVQAAGLGEADLVILGAS